MQEGILRKLGAAIGALALGASVGAAAQPVVELRQYKIVEGRRDAFVSLFDREFVETQEAAGMRLVGQFRDLDDPNRFVWMREFPDMAARERSLTAFYSSAHWQALRGEANTLLADNDNVLLLKPAGPGRGLPLNPDRAAVGAPTPQGLVVANFWRLWAEPDADFARFFEDVVRPELEAAGLPVVAAYLPERAANTFPALPVREGEKVFVWFTRAPSAQAYAAAAARLEQRAAWTAFVADQLESPPLVRRLAPTPRSALR